MEKGERRGREKGAGESRGVIVPCLRGTGPEIMIVEKGERRRERGGR